MTGNIKNQMKHSTNNAVLIMNIVNYGNINLYGEPTIKNTKHQCESINYQEKLKNSKQKITPTLYLKKEQKETKTQKEIEQEIEKDVESYKKSVHTNQNKINTLLINQPSNLMTTTLSSFCHKRQYLVIYDSEKKSFLNQEIWSSICGRNNIMIIIKDWNGNVFGSFHEVVPKKMGEYSKKDYNHFVFSLNNPYHNPMKFKRKVISPILKIHLDNESILTVSGFLFIGVFNSFLVSNERFWKYYTDPTDKGTNYFCSNDSIFTVDSMKILQWFD
ncbi:hypothetical protein ENUP19_0240G0003 [Entamoeba nuttalli]|uniref:TLDc domain-containing protein n=2 Tax=Entamoeba nuttalli TaxID=412467 RepID=K2HCA6_ENTNP|nr:hypothetical protein ENU1_092660 [Entamoeba nuttalli P19]EKE40354.1 hypothetical protein ENU1_092660 [Entamoeba nuttalli P19]|eukprot:XP_008857303.1 hypothetical protein ENU1_092660 [Entamoeba nuttalli P19]